MRKTISLQALIFAVLGLSTGLAQSVEMVSLSDEQLGEVAGQDGVLISQEYYFNSLRTPDDIDTDGAMDTAYCNGSFLNCRFTWQIAGREDGVSHSGLASPRGEWLVYKDGYLSLSVNRLQLDASFLGEGVATGVLYESFYNPGRFKDSAGNCLLEGVVDCDNVSQAIDTIRKMPGLRTHYPETSGSYSPGSAGAAGVSSGYNDARIALQFAGLAIEYDSITAPATPGFLRNENGSFMGFSMADNNRPMAGIAFGGDFYLYGF